ncbi:hypothetical protein INT43_006903 [Umbelopsis isabellina]|uniref:Uncharacterized protein n=1 Tax=Mortierella isabellina TaxID=91625 RepID=A0A8H7PX40_MORIS|nr:hypothetical protein INT43_006903 [Umbelopsis isabellina]
MKLTAVWITLFSAAYVAAQRKYQEAHLNYYHTLQNNYGGSVCQLNTALTFEQLKDIDPEVKCTEKREFCPPRHRCPETYEVKCQIGDGNHPADCDKVKRVCEVSMQGKLLYGTCVKVNYNPGDCCYKLEDTHTGLWSKNRQGKCPFLCFGVISLPGAEWCKTCSCDNPERGTGQGGSKSYGDLC